MLEHFISFLMGVLFGQTLTMQMLISGEIKTICSMGCFLPQLIIRGLNLSFKLASKNYSVKLQIS